MKKIRNIAFIALGFAATSCTAIFPAMVTNASATKTFTLERPVRFGIIKDLDLSVAEAAKKGGISKVASVDYGTKVTAGKTVYYVIVTGE